MGGWGCDTRRPAAHGRAGSLQRNATQRNGQRHTAHHTPTQQISQHQRRKSVNSTKPEPVTEQNQIKPAPHPTVQPNRSKTPPHSFAARGGAVWRCRGERKRESMRAPLSTPMQHLHPHGTSQQTGQKETEARETNCPKLNEKCKLLSVLFVSGAAHALPLFTPSLHRSDQTPRAGQQTDLVDCRSLHSLITFPNK